MQPPTIFFSYSHNDRKLRNHLEKHLSAFKEQAIISSSVFAGESRNWAPALSMRRRS